MFVTSPGSQFSNKLRDLGTKYSGLQGNPKHPFHIALAPPVAWRESICVGRTHLADAQAVRSYIEEYAQTEWPGHCYSLTVRPPYPLHTGACTINRPCAQEYVGKSQSCMVISGRLIVHAPVHTTLRFS